MVLNRFRASMSSSPTPPIEADAIHALVTRLARPCRGGGHVIERAAIVAAGPDSAAIEAWILAHAGTPELPASASLGGLHGHQLGHAPGQDRAPRRFTLPVGVL
jgi:hypothetical protein